MNVIAERAQIERFIALYGNGLVAALKEMSSLAVFRIEACRIGALQPSHAFYKIPLWSLQKKVVMIAHEDIAVNKVSRSLAGFRQGGQKDVPILIISEDGFPPIPTAHHMVNCSFILDEG